MNPEEHRTSNIQRRTSNGRTKPRSLRRSKFDVRRSMFSLGLGVSTGEFSFREILSRKERVKVRGKRALSRMDLFFAGNGFIQVWNQLSLKDGEPGKTLFMRNSSPPSRRRR